MDPERSVMRVPPRDVPLPGSVSPEAQAFLAAGAWPAPPPPALDDHDAWRAFIDVANAMVAEGVEQHTRHSRATVEEREVAGVPVYVITPEGVPPDDPRVYYQIHGGGLIMGHGDACRGMGIVAAERVGATTWAIDYRMPPDHPYPAGLDDCLATYRALLDRYDPGQIIVGGESAGGCLAPAMVLRARDEGLPLPAGLVLVTPENDLTESGDSFHTNLGVDTILTASLMQSILLYADGHDLSHPYLSPLFGDFDKGFPPTILITGTRDLFLSNTVRMHRALRRVGVEAHLHVQEAAPHGGFQGAAPEDAEIADEIRLFAEGHWPSR